MPKIPDSLRDRMPRVQVETYTTGHARSWFWRVLPSPLVSLFSIVTAGSITGLALFLGDRYGGGKGYLWSLIAVGAMTVIAGVVAFIANRRAGRAEQRRSTGFEDAVRGSAAGWDASAGDAAEIARLDDLRNKFQQGIQIFHDYGKDLYELPWYVVVGEPGSGKSEAIRHSELRFPQGLQDRLQGVGGTQSMNWWFTNNAVLLDTAGAMLTQPEAGERFTEFLRLLREYRPDFPINGLILTLPVDKLLIDPPHVAEEKARSIALQLSLIQKSLDIRFPLYLMVTKSDRLPGFREFFDAEGQSAFEPQMVGWSNPDTVGVPFDPVRIEEALEAIASRLHARVLALLGDPIARVDGRRRLDEVDAIYSFPETIRSLRSRLQCYLDTIFQMGTWSAKAPFFRGVYFTSALREGGQLDEALAAALRVDIQRLPTGGIFTQDKPAFLRDVFLSKVFPESGLVTRLKDVGSLLRQRLLLFYTAVLAVLLLLLLLTFMVRSSLTRQLAAEQEAWLQANATWTNGTLLSPLVRRSSGPSQPPVWAWIEQGDPLAHTGRMLDTTAHRLRFAWVFSPLTEWRDFERRRRNTGLSLYEASVMKPLLDAARERIRWDTARNARRSAATEERLAGAFGQLVKLEGWVHGTAADAPVPDEKAWQDFFSHLLAYVLDQPADAVALRSQQLAQLTQRAYGRASLAARDWLADDEQEAQFSSLRDAASLLFGQTAAQARGNDRRQAELNQQQARLLETFKAAEARAEEWSREPARHSRQQVETECLKPMRDTMKEYNDLLAVERGAGNTVLAFGTIVQAAQVTLSTLNNIGPEAALPLHAFRAQATQLVGSSASAGAASNSGEGQWSAARSRLESYEKSFSPLTLEESSLSKEDMLGNLRLKIQGALDYAARFNRPASAAAPAPAAGAPPSDPGGATSVQRFLESYRGVTLVGGVLKEYQAQLQRDLAIRLKFPLVDSKLTHRSLNEFGGNCEFLSKVEIDRDDLIKFADPNMAVAERDELRDYLARLRPVFDIKRTLLSSGVPGRTDGLFLRIDGALPAEKIMVQPAIPMSGGVFSPPLAPAPPVEVLGYGVKSISVKVGGSVQHAPATGQGIDVGYNGFATVEITVTKGQSGLPDDKFSYSAGEWETLRQAVHGRGKKIGVGRSGLGFVLVSNPLLPFEKWPKRADFGLAE